MLHLDSPGFDTGFLSILAIAGIGLLIFTFFFFGDVWSRYRELRRRRTESNEGWTWADFGYLVGLTEPDLPPAYKLEESELERRYPRSPGLQSRDEPVNHPARLS